MTVTNEKPVINVATPINNILKVYHTQIDEFLEQEVKKNITEPEVIISILNILTNVSANIFYSLKFYLPKTDLDYPFLIAKTINTLKDLFEEIKTFNAETNLIKLSSEQLIELYNNGHLDITLPDGSTRRVTKEEILVKKEDVDRIIKEEATLNKDAKDQSVKNLH